MRFENIEKLNDPRTDAYVNLTEIQLRNRLEPEKGIFIAESPKVIERALKTGLEPLSFLVEESWIESMREMFSRVDSEWGSDIAVYVAKNDILKALTGYRLHRGALCAMRRPKMLSVEQVCRNARVVAVLENIVDFTNVGAIFRSAAALNVDAVLATPSCGDPLYRRSARVSMGTVFQVPWTRIAPETLFCAQNEADCRKPDSRQKEKSETQSDMRSKVKKKTKVWPEEGIKQLKNLGFTTVSMALSDDSITPGELVRRMKSDKSAPEHIEKVALIFGTEGDGLSRKTIAQSDVTVKIPMAHGVDSLNVAASSAVIFYTVCEQ